jgi:hypothetical protein
MASQCKRKPTFQLDMNISLINNVTCITLGDIKFIQNLEVKVLNTQNVQV